MKMYQAGNRKSLSGFGLAEQSRAILLEDLSLPESEPVVAAEVTSFRFVSGVLVWLDITSSITAGMTPQLHPYHPSVLTSTSQTKLEGIMGCKNWVMLQIGRIAALQERKAEVLQQGHFDCSDFAQTVGDISREIQCGLNQTALEGFNISEVNSAATSDHTSLITRIFAYMAIVYLHIVTQGFQGLDAINTTISDAMEMLQTQMPIHLLSALVCPLFILGAAARQGDEQFFRDIFSSPSLLDPVLKHRERILPILKEIWSGRQSTPGFAWKDSLELTKDILLI
jgi:hypothetical protein